MDVVDIERYYLLSGVTALSVMALRHTFPRLLRYMVSRGVEQIPSPCSLRPDDALASNLLCLHLKERALVRDSAAAHNLRNIARVRSWKP
jgi:hypothetical protein